MDTIRILTLDGGGTRAGILARALAEIYGADSPGRAILRRFRYVAANSGGSIVLAALCCDYTPREICELYDDPATVRRLFSPKWVASVPILRKFLPRYSASGKYEALREILDRKRKPGEPPHSSIRLSEWPERIGSDVNLLVTAFDYDRQRAAFFRSSRQRSLTKSSTRAVDPTLAEAVHASTNAPIVYFDRPAAFDGHRYWDGAMAGYNNPVLAAVIEALANEPPERVPDFRVLSIGTGTTVRPLTTEGASPPLGEEPSGEGWWRTLHVAATSILDDPPDAAMFHAHMALRQKLPAHGGTYSDGMLVRISPMLRPEWDGASWTLPRGLDERDFAAIAELELDGMDREALDMVRLMAELWIGGTLANQPIRMGERFRCEIGHDRFADALEHWLRIAGEVGEEAQRGAARQEEVAAADDRDKLGKRGQ
jgi:hypothetical protein